jgi:transposase
MEQQDFSSEMPLTSKLESFSREKLIDRVAFLEQECARAMREVYRLKKQDLSDWQIKLIMEEQLRAAQGSLYGASSERYKKSENTKDKEAPAGEDKPRSKKPSDRYPNAPIREEVIKIEPAPSCDLCGRQMSDSGMVEESEKLTVIPKKFEIIRTQRAKYRCSCQGCIVTAPVPARIISGSSYSDEMIIDVALSKYCDLIPMYRYVAMASRLGVKGIPAHSLIETTHGLAKFLTPVYGLLRDGVLEAKVMHADETPHRMLEGSPTKSWYLWGFSTLRYSYFECRDTRSGDVASEVLKFARCEFLVSDVYSGYGKATRIVNESRIKRGIPLLQNAYCNAHARRYFYKARQSKYLEAEFFLDSYHEIYELDKQRRAGPPLDEGPPLIEKMRELFKGMKEAAYAQLSQYPEKGQYGKALRYFLGNYDGLALFLDHDDVPIDNNPQERQMRNHVVGRKTWYGTHSKLGARTAAILFSIVEACRLNGVNPREYFPNICADLLAGKPAYTPYEFKLRT